MKNWRNNQPGGDDAMASMLENGVKSDLENNFNSKFSENGNGAFPMDATSESEETFGISKYILVILTLVVVFLFFNWYKRSRTNVRVRRKYYLLNKLGI